MTLQSSPMDSTYKNNPNQVSLLSLLKEHFGFTSFRPLQEEIIRDSLAGRDVVALLPTGGGKSLCFQLPALAKTGLTLVISPLIALMKDQVDALQANGIASTFLNSSLSVQEIQARLRGVYRGNYQLLYMAPERLMLPESLHDFPKWQVNLLAIDEAHCISEWGHDFRPEYRRLEELRERFPALPIMALTATATRRVRDDIRTLLKLENPASYIASFNRPNLTYRILPKSNPVDQVLAFLRSQPLESGIVYCQSRKTAELLATRLQAHGIKAQPYHAGLSPEERSRHQELFLRDEIQVMCATIAFGMGINKPNVRFVIHYDLPKNIESYYQETGRAGRDGLPSECLLLFSAGDAVKQHRFINEKPDIQEQEIARTQLQQMVQYAECPTCRRVELLGYFGEEFTEENCGGCDNCLSPRDTFDGTDIADTLLSCIETIYNTSGFRVGLNHVIAVLTGANTEKIRRWRHHELPMHGQGKAHSRPTWAAMARELIRLGYLRQNTEAFSVMEITQQGQAFIHERHTIMLTKPINVPPSKAQLTSDQPHDESLFNRLRQLRKTLADERNVPAYVIFSDVALRQMAQHYPTTEQEFLRISGVGNRKLEEFGAAFLAVITEYITNNPQQKFSNPSAGSTPLTSNSGSPPKPLSGTIQETLRLFQRGFSIEHIAKQRGLVASTIYGHLDQAIQAGEPVDINRILTPEQQTQIATAFAKIGLGNLTGAKELLGDLYDYGQLRLFRTLHTGK